MEEMLESSLYYGDFFRNAPKLNESFNSVATGK